MLPGMEPAQILNAEDYQPEERWMQKALHQAAKAAEADEVPVGAVIIRQGRIIAQAHNQVELLKDATAHAEMIAITQAASAIGDWRLTGCVLYVTKEPCPMCAGAIVLSRVPVIVWGVSDPLRGGATSRFQIVNDPNLNHRPRVITGLLEAECRHLLQSFFQRKRTPPAQDS